MSRDARLLPQPGGFEGFVASGVLAAARDLPFADRAEDGEDQVGLNAAQLRPSHDPQDRHDLILSRVDQLQWVGPEPIEHVDPVLNVGTHRLLAMYRATVVDRTLDSPVID